MEEAYVSRPDKSQIEGQADCFSQLPEGASAFSPQVCPTPTQEGSRPAEGLSNFITRASAMVAQKIGNLTRSTSEVGVSASGAALEEVSLTSPVHTAENAAKCKGEPLVYLLFYPRKMRSAGEELSIHVITQEYVPFIQISASS